MRYKLSKDLPVDCSYEQKYCISMVDLEGLELLEFLHKVLMSAKEGSLDPILADNSPDVYIRNLSSGRLGEFSKRYISTAVHDDETIGILIGLPEPGDKDIFHIYSLCVTPSYRNKGIGTELITKCLSDISGLGYKKVLIDVHAENSPAMKLYEKLGFSNI